MAWHRTGTVKTTLNSSAIVGTGTAFLANTRVGDGFVGPDGALYEITNVASDTTISIAPNYKGPTVAAGSYAVIPVQGYEKGLADQARDIINQWGATLAGIGSAAMVNILGSVSAGALMEVGGNSAGSFFKFQNGLMIQFTVSNTSQNIAANAYTPVPVALPAAFNRIDLAYVHAIVSATGSNDHYGVISSYMTGNSAAAFVVRNGPSAQVFSVKAIAIGTWK